MGVHERRQLGRTECAFPTYGGFWRSGGMNLDWLIVSRWYLVDGLEED